MTQPVGQPAYWNERLTDARRKGVLFHSVYVCHPPLWGRIEERHREILERHVGLKESVLDVGCGYGRLIRLMPAEWHGPYLGVDLSPDMIELAKQRHTDRRFTVHDCVGSPPEKIHPDVGVFDWAVLISVKQMIVGQRGVDVWERMRANVRAVSRRILILEYDPDSEGVIE